MPPGALAARVCVSRAAGRLGEVASPCGCLQPHLSLRRCELRQGRPQRLSLLFCLLGWGSGGRWAREAAPGENAALGRGSRHAGS